MTWHFIFYKYKNLLTLSKMVFRHFIKIITQFNIENVEKSTHFWHDSNRQV